MSSIFMAKLLTSSTCNKTAFFCNSFVSYICNFGSTLLSKVLFFYFQNGMNSEMVTRFPEQGRGKTTIYRKLKWPPDSLP